MYWPRIKNRLQKSKKVFKISSKIIVKKYFAYESWKSMLVIKTITANNIYYIDVKKPESK